MGNAAARSALVQVGSARPTGQLSLTVIRGHRRPPQMPPQQFREFLRSALRRSLPSSQLCDPLSRLPLARADRIAVNRWRLRNFVQHLLPGMRRVALARSLGLATLYGALDLTVIYRIGLPDERRLPLGLVGLRSVTNTGVAFLVDAWQNSTELENMKFHALGTGSTAEDVGDTALVTELTTEYTGNVRATGNLTEGASANILHTEGTNTLDETPGGALREHAVMSQAATGGGTMWDRTVYAAITLSAGDGLLSKYEATLSAGG